jgi:diguanylate cyclase (GGDEF)-like protein
MTEHRIESGNLAVEQDATHSWLSNPLDWRFIDRLIILGLISFTVSVIFSTAIFAALYFQSTTTATTTFLNEDCAIPLLLVCIFHGLLNLVFTAIAFKKRENAADWPLFAYVIAFSFVILVLIIGYATGTYFSDGIVLLLFGFALCLPLMDLDILSRVYMFAWAGFMVLMGIDFSGAIEFAPLFSNVPMEGQRPIFAWHLLRVAISFCIFVILFFVTLPTTRRWRDREDLYREMSNTDGLTRLTNRRSFISRSNAEFSKLKRMPGQIACIMIDLDYFKQVNDNHGHQAGDAVLVQVAQILAKNAREYDEVGRYGGEEFAILLPNTSKENAAKIAERIRENIEQESIDTGEVTLNVTASFGVSGYPSEGIEDINGLLKRADEALYAAKEKSRNVVVISEN